MLRKDTKAIVMGAIIGDIVGSVYEFANIDTKDFPFMPPDGEFTDDTVMTCAVAHAIAKCAQKKDFADLSKVAVKSLQEIGRVYPRCGYGARFIDWMFDDNPKPYNSLGNGSAMRISPVGAYAESIEEAKNFLDSHRNEKGILSPEDTQAYEKMEQEIVNLGHEIERQERMDAMERELNAPVSSPLTSKPETAKQDEKTGRTSDAYKKAFWAQLRNRNAITPELKNALQEDTNSEGGYLVPDEFERTLVQALNQQNIIRDHARIITTSNGLHKIPVVSSHGTAAWVEEESAYTESDEVFGQVSLDTHKVGTLVPKS